MTISKETLNGFCSQYYEVLKLSVKVIMVTFQRNTIYIHDAN